MNSNIYSSIYIDNSPSLWVYCSKTASTVFRILCNTVVHSRSSGTLVNVRWMMRNSGRHMCGRRRVNKTAWSKRVDEPVDRIPMHGTSVDRARWYHSGQRYPSRLYLVRGGGGDGGCRNDRAWMTWNGATAMYGTSSMLRHNWNSMTPWTGKDSSKERLNVPRRPTTSNSLRQMLATDIFDSRPVMSSLICHFENVPSRNMENLKRNNIRRMANRNSFSNFRTVLRF